LLLLPLPSWSDATASRSSTFSSVHVSVTSPQHFQQTALAAATAVCLNLVSTARLQQAQGRKLTSTLLPLLQLRLLPLLPRLSLLLPI